MNARRPHEPRRPLRGRSVDRVGPRLAFLHHAVGTTRPLSLENLLGVLQRGKHADRLASRGAVGLKMGGRGVLEVRHVHRRRAVQRVERHVERMPRAGQLEAGILQGMRVRRNRHFVVEPPAPLAVAAVEVVRRALNDLPERPRPARDRILERLVPLRPRVFLANGSGRFEQRAPRGQRGGDLGAKLPRQAGYRVPDVDRSAVDALRREQLRELLSDVVANRGF